MTKLGIIQSRGIGDIVIALPIAKHYADLGHEIYWPICEEFISHFETTVPWVHWLAVTTDPQGRFFLDTPLERLAEVGITDEDDMLYLYQYLSSVPERTDPDLFAMMKFDQYKYAVAGVPFGKKWDLDQCITRDPARESKLYDQLVTSDRYMVYQQRASDVEYQIDLSGIEPGVQCIEITEVTDSIFDWLQILEGAETIVLIDSVFANLIDQLKICGDSDLNFMRKWNRRVDGNPVLLGDWSYVPVETPPGVQVQSLADVAGAVAKQPQPQPAVNPAVGAPNRAEPGQGSAQTYSPFGATQGGVPTSFLGATRQAQQAPTARPQGPAPQAKRLNSAQSLLAGLGLRQ
jgi:hypothetical protein